MQKKRKENSQPEESPSVEAVLRDWISSEFINKFGKKAGIFLVVVAVAVSAFIYQRRSAKEKTFTRNKQLGKAYVLYSQNKLDSAEKFLMDFIATPHSQLVQSKAYLLLGNARYLLKKYEESLDSYLKVSGSPDNQSLITSGALHGIASCYMQMGDYDKAAVKLEEFVTVYMNRTGDLKQRSAGREPADLSPAVPNALWKLALCYQQIKEPEKTRNICDKLIKVYGETEEAVKAARLLLTI
ncbi:tol-pal system YbgF family protein [Fibrobacterota bacterium]